MRFFILAAILAASPVSAGMFDGTSIGHGTSTSEVMPIAEGKIVIKTNSSYEMFDVADDHPLKGASGPCFGVVSVMQGQVSGGGNCIYDTADGKSVMRWNATGMGADGALTGDWMVQGGSGAWATASGSGTFSSLTNPDTGKFVNTIEGSITLK